MKSGFLEMTDKLVKPIVKLTKRKREKTQINKTRDEKGNIAKDTEEIQRNIRT